MGQLRDWWPSEEALAKTTPSPSPSLQLSHAAAAEDGPHLPRLLSANITLNSDNDSSSFLSSLPSSSPTLQARPLHPLKLINSRDHKQELLRNLLHPPNVTADLAHQVHNYASPSLCSQEDNVRLNPTSPSFGSIVHNNKPSSSSLMQDDISLGLFRGCAPQVSSVTHTAEALSSGKVQKPLHVNESSTVEATRKERSSAFGVFHPPADRESFIPQKSHSLTDATYAHLNKGRLMNHGAQDVLQQPLKKKPSNSQNTQSLNDVQHHSLNKESLSRREIHIFSERQRRKGMSHLYNTLLSLLPDAKPKTDRCKVLTDAIDYIHILKEQVDALGCQRSELLASLGEQQGDDHNVDTGSSADGEATNSSTITGISDEVKDEVLSSADVAVRFCGKDAFVTLNGPKKKGAWSGILQILHEHDMEIVNVTLSTGNELHHHCIHARLLPSSTVQTQELEKMLQDLILSHAIVG